MSWTSFQLTYLPDLNIDLKSFSVFFRNYSEESAWVYQPDDKVPGIPYRGMVKVLDFKE